MVSIPSRWKFFLIFLFIYIMFKLLNQLNFYNNYLTLNIILIF